jgi:hypothetical protein
MKHPLIIVFLAFFIVLGANQLSIWVNGRYLHPPGMGFDGPKLSAAVAAYKHVLEGSGTPVPDTVSLAQLLNRGLLKPEDVRAFAGWQVSISLKADEAAPQAVLMRARRPDGDQLVLLTDGSVQQVKSKTNLR